MSHDNGKIFKCQGPYRTLHWHVAMLINLFTSMSAPCMAAEIRTVMESPGLAKDNVFTIRPHRNSLLTPAQSRWQESGILDGVFKVDSVYDLIWLHLQTSYIIYIIAFEYYHLLGKQK